MKFTLSWLKEHLDTDESLEKLADKLPTPVSVVRHAPEDMGRIAAELAYARLGGHDGPPVRREIPCELVARGSGEVAP